MLQIAIVFHFHGQRCASIPIQRTHAQPLQVTDGFGDEFNSIVVQLQDFQTRQDTKTGRQSFDVVVGKV
jgi:hypothetical protein